MNQFWMDDDEPAEKQWTLQDIYDDLGTKTDVAHALDVTIWRMNAWLDRRERIKCPLPVKTLGSADIYSIEEWRGWYAVWCGDPRRKSWIEKAKTNGTGLPFFEHTGPDRGNSTRRRLKKDKIKSDEE